MYAIYMQTRCHRDPPGFHPVFGKFFPSSHFAGGKIFRSGKKCLPENIAVQNRKIMR